MKYIIRQLEAFCIDYLLNNLNAENFFIVLQFCINCQIDLRLMEGCKRFMRFKTESVVKAENFTKISHECLALLLEQESLDIAEVRLFEAVCYFYSSNSIFRAKQVSDSIALGCWLGKICLWKVWRWSKWWKEHSLKIGDGSTSDSISCNDH